MSRYFACSLLLHIHTRHLTEEAMDWLNTVGEHDYPVAVHPSNGGVLIHVDDLVNLLDPIPEGMPMSIDDVLEFAQDQVNAKWLRIDDNGERCVDDLPLYDEVEEVEQKVKDSDYECSAWFERDNAVLTLTGPDGVEIFSLRDEDLHQAVEDGFLTTPKLAGMRSCSDSEWHPHAVAYARQQGLIP